MKEVLKEVKFKFFTNWLSSIWKEEIKTRRKFQLILQTQKIIFQTNFKLQEYYFFYFESTKQK